MATQTPTKPTTGATAPRETTPERITPATAREPRRDGGLSWLILLGLVALASVALLVELQRPAVWTPQEALTIAIAAETHTRKAPIAQGETSLDAWTPVYDGSSRWDLPPGGVWLNQLMYLGLSDRGDAGASMDLRRYVLRSRLGVVLMALLFVASVYWSGHSIGGTLTGTLSALVAMTMPVVVVFGRHANADLVAAAWSSLSIAGALWAMRPLRAAPALGRQLIGWLVCGVGLGLSALTAGPIAVPATLVCMAVIAALCPRRIGHIMGLLASTAIAALMLTPWVLHVHDHEPDLWQRWLGQVTPTFTQAGWGQALSKAGGRLALFALLTGPWLLWLGPALTQVFSTSSADARRRMMLGWAWLICAAALLAIAPQATQRPALLFAVAPAALAIGQTLNQFHRLSAEARHARLWRITRWLTCAAMLALSLALPTLGYLLNHRPDAIAWLAQPDPALLQATHWAFYAGLALALTLITALALRFAIANHPAQTAACLALWLIVGYAMAAIPITRGPMLSTPASPPALSSPADPPPNP